MPSRHGDTIKNRGVEFGRTAAGGTTHVLTAGERRPLCSARIDVFERWWSEFRRDPVDEPLCATCVRVALAAAVAVLPGGATRDAVLGSFSATYPDDSKPPVAA